MKRLDEVKTKNTLTAMICTQWEMILVSINLVCGWNVRCKFTFNEIKRDSSCQNNLQVKVQSPHFLNILKINLLQKNFQEEDFFVEILWVFKITTNENRHV